jgi:hypothetical protein
MGPYLRYDGADAMSLLRRISADERPLSVSPFALSVLGSIELERTYKTRTSMSTHFPTAQHFASTPRTTAPIGFPSQTEYWSRRCTCRPCHPMVCALGVVTDPTHMPSLPLIHRKKLPETRSWMMRTWRCPIQVTFECAYHASHPLLPLFR